MERNRLNNKGYMLVEIILASAIAFGIAYFIMDMTINLKNKNDDLLVETLTTTDQAIITNMIMEKIKANPNEFECKDVTLNGKVFEIDNKKNIVNEYVTISYDKDNDNDCLISDDKIRVNVNLSVSQIPGKDFDVNVTYYKNIVSVDGIKVNAAVNETITIWNDSNIEIGKITTDDLGTMATFNGVTALEISLTPGKYTFVSSVASNDINGTCNGVTYDNYCKEVTVDKDTEIINVYPDGAIYWYGNGWETGSSLYTMSGGFGEYCIGNNDIACSDINSKRINKGNNGNSFVQEITSGSTTRYNLFAYSNNKINIDGYSKFKTYLSMNENSAAVDEYKGTFFCTYVRAGKIGLSENKNSISKQLSTSLTKSGKQLKEFDFESIDAEYKVVISVSAAACAHDDTTQRITTYAIWLE